MLRITSVLYIEKLWTKPSVERQTVYGSIVNNTIEEESQVVVSRQIQSIQDDIDQVQISIPESINEEVVSKGPETITEEEEVVLIKEPETIIEEENKGSETIVEEEEEEESKVYETIKEDEILVIEEVIKNEEVIENVVVEEIIKEEMIINKEMIIKEEMIIEEVVTKEIKNEIVENISITELPNKKGKLTIDTTSNVEDTPELMESPVESNIQPSSTISTSSSILTPPPSNITFEENLPTPTPRPRRTSLLSDKFNDRRKSLTKKLKRALTVKQERNSIVL